MQTVVVHVHADTGLTTEVLHPRRYRRVGLLDHMAEL